MLYILGFEGFWDGTLDWDLDSGLSKEEQRRVVWTSYNYDQILSSPFSI